MPIVIDASVTLVWALADEDNQIADRALVLAQNEEAVVPSIWWYEIRKALIVSERRHRLALDDSEQFLQELSRLSVDVDNDPDERSLFILCRRHRLSFYDAGYLEVAQRRNLALATLDAELMRAARRERITLVERSS